MARPKDEIKRRSELNIKIKNNNIAVLYINIFFAVLRIIIIIKGGLTLK
jgi:hypothetical protein